MVFYCTRFLLWVSLNIINARSSFNFLCLGLRVNASYFDDVRYHQHNLGSGCRSNKPLHISDIKLDLILYLLQL